MALKFVRAFKKNTIKYLEFHPACVILVRFSRGSIRSFNLPRAERKKYAGFRRTKGRYEGHVREKRETIGGNVNQRTIQRDSFHHSFIPETCGLMLSLADGNACNFYNVGLLRSVVHRPRCSYELSISLWSAYKCVSVTSWNTSKSLKRFRAK